MLGVGERRRPLGGGGRARGRVRLEEELVRSRGSFELDGVVQLTHRWSIERRGNKSDGSEG